MTVSTVASVASGVIQRTLTNKNNYADSIKSLLTASGATGSRTDTPSLSTAISLQTQVSGLRSASLGIAQSSSLVEVASNGAGQVSRVLGRLQELTTRASASNLSDAARAGLDVEFQALKAEINRIANSTQFGGRLLLNGNVSAESLGIEGGEGLPDLTTDALFGKGGLSISTSEAAGRALEKVKAAQTVTTDALANIGGIAGALELGASTIESAIQNQDASRSTLSEADLLQAATQNAQAQVENESALSLLAQTNHLPGNILQLLAE